MRIDSGVVNSQFVSEKTHIQEMKPVGNDKVDISKKADNNENNSSFPGERKLIEAIEKSNVDLVMPNTSLSFSINEKTKKVIVKVVDEKTKEVIREVPSEKILEMIAEMMEKSGFFVDKRG